MTMNSISRFPTTRLLLSEAEFCAWLGQAVPGERVEYYRGFLAVDTTRDSSMLPESDRKELVRVGRRAWWAGEKNLVHLVQRRYRHGSFSYLAIARRRPKVEQAALLSVLGQASDPDGAVLTDPSFSLRRSKA
jgi:hypothetical protein